MGDSGLEILHGGVGGDVEQGARTSKHICSSAFDPLSLELLLSFILAKHLQSEHSYCLLAFVPCIFHIAISLVCLVVLCVPHLYSSNKSFT